MLNLSGRGAIVAGTRRVGAQVVRRLADEGVNLAIVYRSSRSGAEDLFATIQPQVGHSALIQADLSIESDVKRAVAEAKQTLGDLSFCINLAADYPRVPFDQLDEAAWDHGILAAKANYLLTLHASRAMMENSGPTRGHFIHFGDWAAGETPYTEFLPYLSAKAAILFMTRAFAVELAPHGILVNAISPGPTAQAVEVSSDEWQEALADTPLHRESSVDEIAELIVTLLRLETITGEEIRVDAGRHIAGTGRPKPAV
ncbi:MAG TPA: SDR family oxidoreductase [Dehalococcoidia bacterium]|nr:SDR family oxidoreductase [Dehalococcoidia bacterium]